MNKGKKAPLNTTKKKSVRRNRKSTTKNTKNTKNTKILGLFKLKRQSTSNQKPSALASHSVASTTAKAKTKPKSAKKLKNITAKPQRSAPPKISWLLVVYILTVVVGLSTILGTTMAIVDSWQTSLHPDQSVPTNSKESNPNQLKLEQIVATAALGQEIHPLKLKLENLAQEYPDLQPELFVADIDTKGFVSLRGDQTIASASTIKLPILVAFLQDLDRGGIKLDEQLSLTKQTIAGGSGDMQHQPPGTKFSALKTAEKMITISDNTATNMLIERLGGQETLNQRFIQMGLTATKLRNLLPDLTGTNTTSPQDLGNLLLKIESGELLSLRSRDRLLHIMGNVAKDTLLPQGLEAGAIIAHKTGDIKSVLADVGLIDMPNGKRYIASILVQRPDNAPQAEKFIQQASSIVYQYFKNPQKVSLEEIEDEETIR